MKIRLTEISNNKKVGHIPVTTTERASCPDSCKLKNICYAQKGKTRMIWEEVESGINTRWNSKFENNWLAIMKKIARFPTGQFWRHNQAGDLPVDCDRIDSVKMRQLIAANRDKGGFTYTHHNPADNAEIIAESNAGGFTVNLSANNPAQADEYAAMNIAPVVTLVPQDTAKVSTTPAGRKIVICPAISSDKVTCQSCRLCQKVERPIIGFTPHGSGKKSANLVAEGV